MDARAFSRVTRRLARRKRSRRQAIATVSTTIAAAGLAATGLSSASAQDAPPRAIPVESASATTSYLFVQAFQSGSIRGSWLHAAGIGDVTTAAPMTLGDHVRIATNTKTFVATVILHHPAEVALLRDLYRDTRGGLVTPG